MDDGVDRIVQIKQRRLQVLKEQQALFGISTDPAIIIEIQQIEHELGSLLQYPRALRMPPLQMAMQAPPLRGLMVLVSTAPVFGEQAQSAFDAIDYHRGVLEHCWLIASGGDTGSLARAYELRDYFSRRRVSMHVWQVENPTDIGETYTLIDLLYTQHVPACGLAETEVVADVTGATKPMSVGMALACGVQRPMQYMVQQPEGPALPLLLNSKEAGL